MKRLLSAGIVLMFASSVFAGSNAFSPKRYSCIVKTENGKIEDAAPIGTGYYADSIVQAYVLYTADLLKYVSSENKSDLEVVDASDNSSNKGKVVRAKLESISCIEWPEKNS